MARKTKLKTRVPRGVTALQFVARYAPGDRVEWRALEIASLREHPAVVSVVDPGGRYNGGKPYEAKMWLIMIPTMLVGGFIVGAPIWGFTTLFSQKYRTPSATLEWTNRLPVAGGFFALSLLVILVSFTVWLVRGRRPPGFLRSWSTLVLVLGGLSSAIVLLRDENRAEALYGDTWAAVIVGATVLSAVVIILTTVFHSDAAPAPVDQPKKSVRIGEAFAKLTPAQQDGVRADLRQAIADLAARDVITPEQATRAAAAEPGMLAMQQLKDHG